MDLSYNLNPKGQVQPIARSAVTLRALEAGKEAFVQLAMARASAAQKQAALDEMIQDLSTIKRA